MTDKPILFSTDMVRALLDGRKTMTRRLNELETINQAPSDYGFSHFEYDTAFFEHKRSGSLISIKCPYGQKDVLFLVKETYRPHTLLWVSHLILKITDIRVERLQDITEEDALREGVEILRPGYWKNYNPKDGWTQFQLTARGSFLTLWNSLTAKRGYGWDVNPWVWVISFDVIKQNIDEYLKTV